MNRGRFVLPTGLAACLLLAPACARPAGEPLSAVETIYLDTRSLKDRIDVTRSRGADRTPEGTALVDLAARYRAARTRLGEALSSIRADPEDADDRRALATMRQTFEKDLGTEDGQPVAEPDAGAAAGIECDYDPATLSSGPEGMKVLSERMYACFGKAAHHLPFEGKVLDRLTVFSLLPVTDDPARRRRLFLAFTPVWVAINGDDGAMSPYRSLVRLSAAKLAAAHSSVEAGAGDLGIGAGDVEAWLVSVLEAWRAISPDKTIEPWDFAYQAGSASRALRNALPLEALARVNERFYRDLGVDLSALRIRYDITPREGKDPVAFTTFGARQRLDNGAWIPGEPWVFASYSVGGIDNLNELLHETGHAVHIAAIRTRPAFTDWPDSDLFTEAIADIAALELFEPEWQRRYLATSVPLEDSIRAKYAGIVMDVAWALFEIRMHRDPGGDPNAVWSEITQRYFRIRPHPELSWWALRGQLINLPGYMLNYAVGALLVADLRARVRERYGAYSAGDPEWYARVSADLYRFGLERKSRKVIEDFLGRPISPRPLLDDLGRAAPQPAPAR